jgi:hypothetical protein
MMMIYNCWNHALHLAIKCWITICIYSQLSNKSNDITCEAKLICALIFTPTQRYTNSLHFILILVLRCQQNSSLKMIDLQVDYLGLYIYLKALVLCYCVTSILVWGPLSIYGLSWASYDHWVFSVEYCSIVRTDYFKTRHQFFYEGFMLFLCKLRITSFLTQLWVINRAYCYLNR